MASQQVDTIADRVVLGHAKQHPDSNGIVAKFFIVQAGFLKNSKRLLCLTPQKLLYYENTPKGAPKFESTYANIFNITLKDTKTERNEFILECILPKNKKSKDTLMYPQRDYLLSLVQRFRNFLSGKERKFYVQKVTKNTTAVNYILNIVGASILKIDITTQKTVLCYNLIDIKEIQIIKEKPNHLIFYFVNNYRTNYFIVQEPKPLIDTINKQLKEMLNAEPVKVSEITEETAHRIRDKRSFMKEETKFLFRHVVEKVKVENQGEFQTRTRRICGNAKFIAEMDADSENILALHDVTDIRTIIRYPDNDKLFAIEYRHDRLCKYLSADRDFIILNILEMVSRSESNCSVAIEESVEGVREGLRGADPSPEYAELLVKRLNTIDKEPLDEAFHILREFNMSFGCSDIPCKDKTAFKSTVSVLTKIEKDKLKEDDLLTILFALYRLMYCKPVYEDVVNYKLFIAKMFEESLRNKNEG
jgi:hypothetical protein